MAEELKRHGITFSLDLNKHPKDATNLSLINAENFKISEDGASLVSDKSLLENSTIKQALNEYYKQYDEIYEGISYKIINVISTNEEIVLFVENTKIVLNGENIIIISENDNENLNYNKIINIFRYNEKIDECKIIPINNLIEQNNLKVDNFINYYGGKFSGTYTYNVKNELIITFCEYDSVLQTEFECGEPIKIINLGYWENNNLINNSNLNPKTFAICPEVTIPSIINDEIILGDSKKGWYHFYIRYKINNYDYTQWFDFGKSFYLDNFINQTIFDYDINYAEDPTKTDDSKYIDINARYKLEDTFSDSSEICNKSISFELINLSNIYKQYQLAFICSTKIYNECRITEDINIYDSTFKLNYSKTKDYDVNKLLISYENYFNVKNIINYNNRLYISNYKINEIKNINQNINFDINVNEVNLIDNNEYILKLEYLDLKSINTTNKYIRVKSNFNLSHHLTNYKYICSSITEISKTLKRTNNKTQLSKENKLKFYNEINELINDGYYIINGSGQVSKNNYNWFGIELTGSNNEEFLNSLLYNLGYVYLDNIKITLVKYENLKDFKDIYYTYDDNNKRFNLNENLIGYYYILDFNNWLNVELIKQGRTKLNEYYPILQTITNKNIDLNNLIYSLIANQPYNFYIHYIDKYGKISQGFNIFEQIKNNENYFKYINNDFCVHINSDSDYDINRGCEIWVSLTSEIYYKVDKNIYSNDYYDYINKNNIYVKYDDNYISFNDYLNKVNESEDKSNLDYRYYVYYYLINSFGHDTKKLNNYLFGEIINNIDNIKGIPKIFTNLYINYNLDFCFIINNKNYTIDENFNIGYYGINTQLSLMLNNIKLPNNIKSYFISYEKLDKILIHQGITVKRLDIKDWKNIKTDDDILNVSINIDENISDEDYTKLSFYSDELNYEDSIKINAYSISFQDKNLENSNSLKEVPNINSIKNELENEYLIKDINYLVADSLIDNNLNKNSKLSIKVLDGNTHSLSNINLKQVKIYKALTNLYNNSNKILIRLTEITNNPNTEIFSYSHWEIGNAIVTNNNGIRITANNKLNYYNNESYYKKNELMLYQLSYLKIAEDFSYSKEFNNQPKAYLTIANKVDYDNKSANFIQNLLFKVNDLIDLFKNKSLKYDESVLSIYTNYNENNVNQTEFVKTIRRSTYIKDESLENGWRTFEPEAYQNIQENKGEITRIEGIGDLLLVHTKDSLFQFDKSNLLVTENKTVQLGQQDTFDVGYKEIFTSPFGYGGLQDKEAAIVGEFGYIWYNNDFNKIYQYNAGSLNVISGNIEFLLNKHKPIKCRFTDDKQNKRLLIQFQLKNNQILNLTYNYDIKAFISFYIDGDNIINETYNTKTKFYILENNKIFDRFDKSNAKKLSFIINENYTKIKRLNYIKYKLYKRIDNSNGNFDANSPVEGNALSIVNNRRPYSGYKLKVYNDLCTTNEIDIQVDLKSENNIDIKKPYYDLGNFTFNYLRDKDTDSQIFGNFFIVEFIFNQDDYDMIEFESLEYGMDYEEN